MARAARRARRVGRRLLDGKLCPDLNDFRFCRFRLRGAVLGELVFQRGELVLEVKDTLFEFSQFTFLRHACGAFNWSLCEVALQCLMFLRPIGLSVAVDPEKLAQSFAQVPDCIDRDVAGEMHSMRCGRNCEDQLAAPVQFTQE